MHIIPVIDLLDGVVVHAKKGQRQHYQPIQSQLTASCQPLDIVAALLDVYPFTQLYIADLNAIQKINGVYSSHYDLIAQIQQQFPQLTLWVDAGIRDNTALKHWEKLHAKLIIGSENFNELDSFQAMQFSDTNWILSLDFMPDGYCGPIELLTQTQYWPKEVIVMSLAHVGANQGPDMELLTKLLAHANGHHLIAAGGIRDNDDLTQLDALHIHGALIASALHQQQITAAQLASMLK